MDKSTYPRVGQVDLSIGRVVFKNTGVFRERRTFFLDLGLDGAVMTRSKGEQRSGMEERAEERRVIGGGFLPSAFGGGAFGAAAREVKDDFFFLIIFLVGILCEVDRAPFISFLCSPRDVIVFSLFKLITHTI